MGYSAKGRWQAIPPDVGERPGSGRQRTGGEGSDVREGNGSIGDSPGVLALLSVCYRASHGYGRV